MQGTILGHARIMRGTYLATYIHAYHTITLHYFTWHYNTLHGIAVHYNTLHTCIQWVWGITTENHVEKKVHREMKSGSSLGPMGSLGGSLDLVSVICNLGYVAYSRVNGQRSRKIH